MRYVQLVDEWFGTSSKLSSKKAEFDDFFGSEECCSNLQGSLYCSTLCSVVWSDQPVSSRRWRCKLSLPPLLRPEFADTVAPIHEVKRKVRVSQVHRCLYSLNCAMKSWLPHSYDLCICSCSTAGTRSRRPGAETWSLSTETFLPLRWCKKISAKEGISKTKATCGGNEPVTSRPLSLNCLVVHPQSKIQNWAAPTGQNFWIWNLDCWHGSADIVYVRLQMFWSSFSSAMAGLQGPRQQACRGAETTTRSWDLPGICMSLRLAAWQSRTSLVASSRITLQHSSYRYG